jgi:hypothetical protein
VSVFELKRADGKIVQWEGTDGVNASVRYVDAMRVAGKSDGGGIVAWREHSDAISVLGDARRIIG